MRDEQAAFAAGACAAYDDLGIDAPSPLYGYSQAEQETWKRGLAQGYKDIEALMQSERRKKGI